jgi:hypothetical protein
MKQGLAEGINDAPGFRGIVFCCTGLKWEWRSESECDSQAISTEHIHHASQVVGEAAYTCRTMLRRPVSSKTRKSQSSSTS